MVLRNNPYIIRGEAMNFQGKVFVAFLIVILCATVVFSETFGVKKRMKKPDEYGNVVINNFSGKSDEAPVVFKHWLHRSKFTCRLCHVDLGFAMKAGGTGITEADNKSGLYCGACHHRGKEAFGDVEKKRSQGTVKMCDRCHSYGKKVTFKNDFYKLTKGFPRARFGNRVDWLKAEDNGLIRLKDELPGITIKRKALKDPKDSAYEAKEEGMPDIIFSHKKHAVWNGCELCHPEIFGVKKGATVYSMQDIFDGKYCGACHGKVAFVNMDCQLCHTKEVY
jgi:c(7)-type cytochrome triheme protein